MSGGTGCHKVWSFGFVSPARLPHTHTLTHTSLTSFLHWDPPHTPPPLTDSLPHSPPLTTLLDPPPSSIGSALVPWGRRLCLRKVLCVSSLGNPASLAWVVRCLCVVLLQRARLAFQRGAAQTAMAESELMSPLDASKHHPPPLPWLISLLTTGGR